MIVEVGKQEEREGEGGGGGEWMFRRKESVRIRGMTDYRRIQNKRKKRGCEMKI